jgi:hypothetical protein
MLTESKLAMHENAPAPKVKVHVRDGEVVQVGDIQVRCCVRGELKLKRPGREI